MSSTHADDLHSLALRVIATLDDGDQGGLGPDPDYVQGAALILFEAIQIIHADMLLRGSVELPLIGRIDCWRSPATPPTRPDQPLLLALDDSTGGREVRIGCHCARSGAWRVIPAGTEHHPEKYSGCPGPSVEPVAWRPMPQPPQGAHQIHGLLMELIAAMNCGGRRDG
jgi:hypothetical protein